MHRRQEPGMQRTEQIMSKPKSRIAKKAASKTAGAANPTSKLGQLQAMLQRPEGTTIAQLSKALDWQAHSVRGAMSGSLKKKQGLKITASKEEGADRVYRIAG
jgi:hypothetical protein